MEGVGIVFVMDGDGMGIVGDPEAPVEVGAGAEVSGRGEDAMGMLIITLVLGRG